MIEVCKKAKLPDYKERIIDNKLDLYLETFGAVLIEGPKWCGKTWTGINHSHSVFLLSDPKGNFNNKKNSVNESGFSA